MIPPEVILRLNASLMPIGTKWTFPRRMGNVGKLTCSSPLPRIGSILFKDLVDDLDSFSLEPHLFLDVPFVPSEDAVVKALLQMAGVGRKDVVYDLGCGDGRIVVAAAKHYRARAIGIEIDPLRIAEAMEAAADEGVEMQVDFIEESLFDADFSAATVVTLYLLDSINTQLRPRFLTELRPGSRIVSHAFDMGDWKADDQRKVNGITLYKWVVPGQVAGSWAWEGLDGTPFHAELEQKYQQVTGTAWQGDSPREIENAHLQGNQLTLTLREPGSDTARHFALHFEDQQLISVEEYAA